MLCNNAGLILSERSLSADGYEATFAINHLGPFLLTDLLRQRLVDSAPSLGAQIQVTIDAAPVAADVLVGCAGFPAVGLTNVATGVALTALPTTYATAVGPVAVATGTQLVAYRIAWTFATTGTTAGDSALMGKTVTAAFTWEEQ